MYKIESGSYVDGNEEDSCTNNSDSEEDELDFEPFDVHSDGRLVKTASRCSRASWKRPEIGWDVAVTVHRFRELALGSRAKIKTMTNEDGNRDVVAGEGEEDGEESCEMVVHSDVEPNDLQLEFKLGDCSYTHRHGGDEVYPFSQVCWRTAACFRYAFAIYGVYSNYGKYQQLADGYMTTVFRSIIIVGRQHPPPPPGDKLLFFSNFCH